MTKILITEFINQNSLENLNKKFDVKYDEKLCENKIEIEKIIKDYDGLIVRNKTQVNSEILKNASNLKFIGRLGVGLDNIDTEYCKNKNFYVQPATGMNADSVAEYVLSSSLSLIKKIPMFHSGTIKGEWPRTKIKAAEINQKCLGIIGFGIIGKKVAEYSLKNGLNVLAYDPYIKEINDKEINVKLSNLNEIFEKSDIISIHLPLTEETKNIINKETLEFFPKGAIITNSARGDMINDEAMVQALINRRIYAIGLDVYNGEPEIHPGYLNLPNAFILPHLGSATKKTRTAMADLAIDNIVEYFEIGKCKNTVN